MQEKPDYRKSQGAQTPNEQNLGEVHFVKTIFKYLRSAKDTVLVYGAKLKIKLKVTYYADAGFQTDKDDSKSQSGHVFVLNDGAVNWKSDKQSTIAMPFTESEYIAAAEALMKAVWMWKFIDGLGDVMPSNKRPIEMLCDNALALSITNDPGIMKGAKHYQRKYHYIREVIQDGETVLKKVHTNDNLADPDQVRILAKDKGFGQEMHLSEESKALYGVTPPRDYAVTSYNEEMSHHTLYDIKCLQDYAATIKFTRDDVSDSALRRNINILLCLEDGMLM
ncbi:hypothetical protein Tco_1089063 [Tanacetum coccineum]